MQIEIIPSLEQADRATGFAVVIDVFRAFTTEAYIFAAGARAILPVMSLEEAFELRRQNPDFILVGERGGVRPDGFDFGNSPTEMLGADFTGKTIIHTTSNGTKGLLLAANAETVLAGSFVMASSIVRAIRRAQPDLVQLISTSPGVDELNEDILLARYIRDLLQGRAPDEAALKNQLATTAAYDFLKKEAGVPATDFELCLDFSRFDFVIRKFVQDGRICLLRESA